MAAAAGDMRYLLKLHRESKFEGRILLDQVPDKTYIISWAVERIMVLTLWDIKCHKTSIFQDPKHNLILGFDQRESTHLNAANSSSSDHFQERH